MIYICFAVVAVIAAADQLLKLWVVNNIPLGGSMPFIPGVMHLTHIRNTGAAFSMLSDHTWILLAVTVVLLVLLIWYLIKGDLRPVQKILIAFIIGGAIGNGIDRAVLGYVVDMFATDFVDFAIFNLADCFINVGAIVFCIIYLYFPIRERKRESSEKMPELERLRRGSSSEPGEKDGSDDPSDH